MSSAGLTIERPLPTEAHLWAVSIEDPPVPWATLRGYLTAEERLRASRYRHAADGQRSILGRGILRLVLGHYFGESPDRFELSVSTRGKPYLVSHGGIGEFNLSHTGEWVLLGVSGGPAIGVDIERVRPVSNRDRLAARFFTPAEAHAIRVLPPPQRLDSFFAFWTCKEAYLKALGSGLAGNLSTFGVEFVDDRPHLTPPVEPGTVPDWTLWSGSPAPGYVAAAAIHAAGVEITTNRWTAASGVQPWLP